MNSLRISTTNIFFPDFFYFYSIKRNIVTLTVVNVINVLQFILRYLSIQLLNSFNPLIKMCSHTVSTFNPKAQQLQSQTHFRAKLPLLRLHALLFVLFLNFQINYWSNTRKTILRGSKETGYNQATNFFPSFVRTKAKWAEVISSLPADPIQPHREIWS